MKKLINMELDEFLRRGSYFQAFENEIAIIEMDGTFSKQVDVKHDIPLRLDALSIFLICRGEMRLEIDYRPYTVSANCLLDLVEQHIVQNFQLSEDFKGYNVVISRNFLSESLGNNRTLPSDVIVSKRTHPTQPIDPEEVLLLEERIKGLIYYIQQSGHYFQRSLIMNQFSIFMMEMSHIIRQKAGTNIAAVELNSKEQLVGRFLELLSHHSREHQKVTFYAEELCITPEYLTRILKAFSGRTANKWIDNALMTEAKILLRDPDLNIQQIADILHFSDQSSFGKFFKKHSGKSPLEYRKG
ncbi:AraC family transcriptional activator of pobA [Parabacteroides sp. PF5-5]|uniref:helix-turn-helix domain-containing protein n=1 Tax=unclassified Parabacteroides TaxID=2649774 RepID=UPI0024747667|nr:MULTISPECIES: AraC family transcriptional regulator [unclassified Parabacteroides]MDH6303612.1 AraC family transcriptional activator of pobA [Parabacteroides sp. PH5-39]MDH6314934.1 AraC family transcriptional activator of pobA [Parabacteroides sp. PF5-13]MDH6318271.1 AraC family transcriptional activator of pobA [Parabacteroides sp. PH5-13]MDH6321796.1 AraC family transcriptional activator of pobA [Parabacteroides sp. PH5-8]MDH6325920.1 AraC family transcriptional activator of pobA [Paraba